MTSITLIANGIAATGIPKESAEAIAEAIVDAQNNASGTDGIAQVNVRMDKLEKRMDKLEDRAGKIEARIIRLEVQTWIALVLLTAIAVKNFFY